MNSIIKVLAICKRNIFIEAILPLLKLNNIEIISICYNGVTGIETYQKSNPHLVVLDANWPFSSYCYSGVEVAAQLKSIDSNCKIVVATNYYELQTINTFGNYIDGYFYKTMADVLPFMVECFRNVSNNKKHFP